MARNISIFNLGEDASGNFAYLLPAESHIRRIELAADTAELFIVPNGVRRIIFMYETSDYVYVSYNPADPVTAVPSGDDDNGYMPFINPIGLAGVSANDRIYIISPEAGAVHLILGG